MIPSLPGLLVVVALLFLGRAYRAPIIVGFFASLPFQSTAFATLPALGGSSPPIATFFALLVVGGGLLRRGTARDVRAVFAQHWAAWVLVGLTVYVAVGAYLLPRIFEGQTGAFVVIRGAIYEVPLSPVSGNISQAAYFVLGALAYVFFAIMLRHEKAWPAVATGFIVFVTCHALTGFANLFGNLAGLGDVLAPIRTANYAMLVEQQEGGLSRIAGACAETSAFSGLAMTSLAFCVAYWRRTGNGAVFWLGLAHLVLLVLSTSSTAYVSLAILAAGLGGSIALEATRGRFAFRDVQLLGLTAFGLVLVLISLIFIPVIINTLSDLIDFMVFKKHLSASGQERGYWNSQSIRAFYDTHWLGVGIGSSRASSWVVAVLSQIGLVGCLAFAVLLAAAWRAPHTIPATILLSNGVRLVDVAAGARAAILGNLLTASISGTNADPGLLVYVGIAVCIGARSLAAQRAQVADAAKEGRSGRPWSMPRGRGPGSWGHTVRAAR